MPRPFFLIGHNPNSMAAVEACLANGGNAIEPDVYYEDGEYYMMELVPVISKIFPPKKGPKLEDFLTDLKNLLDHNTEYNLALIIFDTKNLGDCNINDLADRVRMFFVNDYPGVSIAFTTGSPKYLSGFNPFVAKTPLEWVGIDAISNADDAARYFDQLNKNYIYGNGTSLPLIAASAPVYRDQIHRAIQLRDDGHHPLLQTVYAYTVNAKPSMRSYLREKVDGLITDNVIELTEVLKEPEFINEYYMAKPQILQENIPI